jgi:hypothetical protein
MKSEVKGTATSKRLGNTGLEETQFIIGITVEGTKKLANELEDPKGSFVSRPRLLPSKCFPTIFHA